MGFNIFSFSFESLNLKLFGPKVRESESTIPSLICAKSLVCKLQGAFAEYTVLAACYHKTMRELWEVSHRPSKALEEARDRLYSYLYLEFLKACRVCAGQVEDYYRGRAMTLPRFCVKLPYEGMLVDAYRDGSFEKHSVQPAANSAFNYVQETGRHYLSNDVLHEVFTPRGYSNPRLHVEGVRANYHALFHGQNLKQRRTHEYYKKEETDPQWESFWKTPSGTIRPGPRSCYKSTLVVPMTLINADLSPEFLNLLLDPNVSKFEKLNFGFVCFDHPHAGFFNENDTAFAYIMADFLSLFLVTQREKTIRSPSSCEIDTKVGKIDHQLAIRTLHQTLNHG